MDTESFIFSYNPIKVLFDDLEHFSKSLHLSNLDTSHDLCSENNITEKKLESSTVFDLDETLFLGNESHNNILPPNSIESEEKRSLSYNIYTIEAYKSCLEENEVVYGVPLKIEKTNSFNGTKNKLAMNRFD